MANPINVSVNVGALSNAIAIAIQQAAQAGAQQPTTQATAQATAQQAGLAHNTQAQASVASISAASLQRDRTSDLHYTS